MKSWNETRKAARKFVERWTFRRGSEKGEDLQFWNSLLGEVLGMGDVTSRVQYQVPVPMKDTKCPDVSLADLYDPLTMPADLRTAHEANDRAVLAAYGLKPDTPEPEIVDNLFRLYAEKVAK